MTIDDLELVPELHATADVDEEGLMPCWITMTCWLTASIFTGTDW